MAKRRRRRGSGSVYQDKQGQWWAKVAIGNGRTRRSRATSRKDAEQKARALSQSADAGIDLVSSQQRTQAWLETWLTTKQASVKPETLAFYRRHCEYTVPHIGTIALEALSATHIRVMLGALSPDLAPRSVAHVLTILRRALDMAVSDGVIARNPAASVEAPRVPTYEPHTLSRDEETALTQACQGERQGLLFLTALTLGLRRGELLHLAWADVDWHAGTLRVRSGKTDAASRYLPLSAAMRAALQLHQAQTREEAAHLGEAWREHGLIFPSEVGTPLTPRNVTRLFKRILRKASLPESIRLHDLRGTAISDWIAAGGNAKAVQTAAGHASPETTLRHYARARAEDVRAAIEGAEARRQTDTDTDTPPRSSSSSAAA
jgi:integrase